MKKQTKGTGTQKKHQLTDDQLNQATGGQAAKELREQAKAHQDHGDDSIADAELDAANTLEGMAQGEIGERLGRAHLLGTIRK